MADDRRDALVERPRHDEIARIADQRGEHAAENGDVEFGGVGEVLEDGARRHAGELGDVANDRRDLAFLGQGQRRRDDGLARAGHTIAAAGDLHLRRLTQRFNVHAMIPCGAGPLETEPRSTIAEW